MALDRLGKDALFADPGDQHRQRHLSLPEARNLDAFGEVGGGVLVGVLDVVRRHGDLQADPAVLQLLDVSLHAAIRADRRRARSWGSWGPTPRARSGARPARRRQHAPYPRAPPRDAGGTSSRLPLATRARVAP